jgi:pimeloyl-ACP methyl ester carboxylesterase
MYLSGMLETTLQLPQGPVRVREEGQGPPIVFVHGLLVDGRLWDDVVAQLSASARCIVPDLPLGAHHTAMRPDADLTPYGLARLIAAVLEELDLHDVTLVANDTGGALSQLVVTRHPERIGRLVLTPCDAFENFLPPMFRPLQYLGGYVPGALALVGQAMRSKAVASSPLGFGPLAIRHRPELYVSWLEPVRRDRGVRRDLRKVLRGIRPRYTLEAAELLPQFRKPALVAWADRERIFPREHAERLARLLGGARLETIADSKTFVPLDQPGSLAGLVAGFLGAPSSTSPPTPATSSSTPPAVSS